MIKQRRAQKLSSTSISNGDDDIPKDVEDSVSPSVLRRRRRKKTTLSKNVVLLLVMVCFATLVVLILVQFVRFTFTGEENENSVGRSVASDKFHFPLSIRTNKGLSHEEQLQQLLVEGGDYELMFHPAEQSLRQLKLNPTTVQEKPIQQMVVPKFWKRLEEPLQKRSQTLSIGLKVKPSSTSSNYNNRYFISPIDATVEINPYDDDGLLETIFVMIASYRDDQCPHTVQSIFARAAFPERVRVAVVDQRERSTDTSCYDSILKYCSGDTSLLHHESEEVSVEEGILVCQQYKHLIDVYDMDAQYGVGPVYARHVGYRMYRGEYYALQVDAHVFFVKEWDVQIIHQFRSTGNEMAVLTTYLTDLENSIDPTTHMSKVFSRPIMCETDWETNDEGNRFYLRNGQQPENEPFVKGTPQLEPYWAAGFSFGRGHFVMQVPYDAYLPMIFQGEEINIGLRAFTYGYDFYAPEFSVCFHMYASGKNAKKRNRIKMFWEHQDRYPGVEDHSYDRLTHILKLDGDDLLTETSTSTWDRTDSDIYGKFQRTYLKCFPRSQMGHFL